MSQDTEAIPPIPTESEVPATDGIPMIDIKNLNEFTDPEKREGKECYLVALKPHHVEWLTRFAEIHRASHGIKVGESCMGIAIDACVRAKKQDMPLRQEDLDAMLGKVG